MNNPSRIMGYSLETDLIMPSYRKVRQPHDEQLRVK